MAFFGFDRSLRLTLIGVALAANPACYSSYTEADDDAGETTAEADGDARDDAARDDAARDNGEPEGVDPPPFPVCVEVPGFSISTTTEERADDHAVAMVRLAGPPSSRSYCSTAVCLSVTPGGGAGAVSDIVQVDSLAARFRYTNPSLPLDVMVPLDLEWRLYCTTRSWGIDEETVRGEAWACRDDSGLIVIATSRTECVTVVDMPPSPMAAGPHHPSTPDSMELAVAPAEGGAFRIRAQRLPRGAVSVRWFAPRGILRRLSDTEAVWTPPPDRGVHVVQVAAVTDSGVAVRVFRHHG